MLTEKERHMIATALEYEASHCETDSTAEYYDMARGLAKRIRRHDEAGFESWVPNLDAFPDARELRNFANITLMLTQYANLKARAMEDRLTGHIESALRIEHECETIYAKIPGDWRW